MKATMLDAVAAILLVIIGVVLEWAVLQDQDWSTPTAVWVRVLVVTVLAVTFLVVHAVRWRLQRVPEAAPAPSFATFPTALVRKTGNGNVSAKRVWTGADILVDSEGDGDVDLENIDHHPPRLKDEGGRRGGGA